MRSFKYPLVLILFTITIAVFGQTPMDKETSFLYFLKVNNQNLYAGTSPYIGSNFTCMAYYCSTFDKNNFENIKDDEFKRTKYYTQTAQIIKRKEDALNFKKEYYIMSTSDFGEYNFSNNSFPITNIFTDCYFKSGRDMLDHTCTFSEIPITIGWIINGSYLNYSINISPDKAERMIDSRKKVNGTVDRSLQTKIIFTIVNEPIFLQPDRYSFVRDGFIIYITRIEFYNAGQLIASIKPATNFEDPVLGYRVINGEDSYNNGKYGGTIKVNRVNGIPIGPVKYYDSKGILSRIVSCNYFFPNKIIFNGDDVVFSELNGKPVLLSIQQYKNNHQEGYYISLRAWLSGGGGLEYASKKDENGKETVITSPMGERGHTHLRISEIPIDAQELIKKYDYNNYFQSPISASNTSNSKITSDNQNRASVSNEVNASKVENTNNEILKTFTDGTPAKQYLQGKAEVSGNKKENFKAVTNVIFLFTNQGEANEYTNQVIKYFKDLITKSIIVTPGDLEKLKQDSIFKVELNFGVRLIKVQSLDAEISTKIYVTLNGKQLADESFTRSTSLTMMSNEPRLVLESAIRNCEKKVIRVLSDYIKIQ